MSSLLKHTLNFLSLTAACCLSAPLHAAGVVPDPITMPSVSVEPRQPVAFQPVTIVAKFSTPYCLSEGPPLLASASLRNGQLGLALSHLRDGICASEKRIVLPAGLAPGSYHLRVSVTANDATSGGPILFARTYEREVGSTSVTVAYPVGWAASELGMARIDWLNTPSAPAVGQGPIQLNDDWAIPQVPFGSPQRIASPLLPGTSALPTANMVVASRTNADTTPAPSPWVPLYGLDYPKPLLGRYFTTSASTCSDLARAWTLPSTACQNTYAAIAPNAAGLCPLGSTPVYQLFQPQALAHRYTIDAELYALLQQLAGYRGEGVAWCAMRPNSGGG